jgi:hypothetical protein
MSDEKKNDVLEEENSEEGSKKVAVMGYAIIGSGLLSGIYSKQTGKQKGKCITLSDTSRLYSFDFETLQDVEVPASQQYHHGYSRRDLKDFTKGNRNLKGRGRR